MYRFKKLQPWDVEKLKNQIRHALLVSSPPSMPRKNEAIRNVYGRLVSGEAQCWILYVDHPKGYEIKGIVVSAILTDHLSDSKMLHIYAMEGMEPTEKDHWIAGYNALRKFAKAHNCTVIAGITSNQAIVRRVTALGGEVMSYVVAGV